MKEHYKGFLAIALAVVLFLIASITIRVALATEIPLAAVSSGSMEPTIHRGSLIIIKGVKPEEINAAPAPKGDIIVYLRSYTIKYDYIFFVFYSPDPIVHRAIKKVEINGKWYFLTKGDANKYYDQNPRDPRTWVPENRVLGKVIYVIPELGYPALFAKTTYGKAVLVLAIIAVLVLWIQAERRDRS